jgi:magnesium chelatase family protein
MMPRPRATELAAPPGEASATVRERVVAARVALGERSPPLTAEAGDLLTQAVERLGMSGRGRARAARVASTIAALAGCADVETGHVAEALSYRVPAEVAG